MASDNVEVIVRLRDYLTASAKLVDSALDSISKNANQTSASVKVTQKEIKKLGNDAAKAAVELKIAAKAVDDVGDKSTKTSAKIALLDKRMEKLGGNGGSLRRLLRSLMIFTAIGGIAQLIGLASTAILGLGGAAYSAISGLAPLSGLLVAYPGIIGAFIQGMGFAKIATHGLGTAITDLLTPNMNPAQLALDMSRLSPAGRSFAYAVASLRPQLSGLAKQLQTQFLPPMTSLVLLFKSKYFGIFAKGMRETGKSISHVLSFLVTYLKTANAQTKVGKIMSTNAKVLKILGVAGVSAFKAMNTVLVAASPMLIAMSESIAKFFENADKNASKNKNGLRKYFDSSLEVAKKVYRWTKDIFGGLMGIGKASLGLSHAMGNSFLDMADKFNKWANSSKGQKQLGKFFKDIKPVVYEMGYLVRDLGKAILDISNDKSFLKTSIEIRTKLLPSLVDFIKHMNTSNFIESISSLLTSLMKLAKQSKIFEIFGQLLKIVAKLVDIITIFLGKMPNLVRDIITWIALLKILKSGLKFLAKPLLTKPIVASFLLKGALFKKAAFLKLFSLLGFKLLPGIGWAITIKMLWDMSPNGLKNTIAKILGFRGGLFGEDPAKAPKNFPGLRGSPGVYEKGLQGLKARFAGGDIKSGNPYLVGEIGMEAFLSKSGKLSMIGQKGAEVRRFNEDGFVIPNNLLHTLDNSNNRSERMFNTFASGMKQMPTAQNNQTEQLAPIHIARINIYPQTKFDVEKAINDAFIQAERNRRERG